MTALDSTFLDLVDGYWAQFLGCSTEALRKERAQVLAHAELANYAGCYLIEFGAAPVISLPADEVEFYGDAIARWRPGVVRTPTVVQAVFGERVATIIGPAFIGYTDAKLFRPLSSGDARLLTVADEKSGRELRNACAAEEWDHGGSTFRPNEMVGVLRGKQLGAVASYKLWVSTLRTFPSLLTRPFAGAATRRQPSVS